MILDRKRAALAASIAPAVESVGNAASALIGLSVLALIVSVVALVVAAKGRAVNA
jgi:hypothetical protein